MPIRFVNSSSVIYAFLMLTPFFPLISFRLGLVHSSLSLLFNGLKDLFVLVAVSLLVLEVRGCLKFRKNFLTFFMFSFLIYSSFHLIGYESLGFAVDGFRHSLIYILLLVALITKLYSSGRLLDFDLFIKILSVHFLVLLIFGLFEYYDADFVKLSYGVSSRNELAYAKFRSEDRIVGTMSNPIIFGAALSICYLAFFYMSEKINSFLLWVAFFVLSLLTFLVQVFTYSRLSLIAFAICFLIIMVKKCVDRNVLALFFSVACFLALIPAGIHFIGEFTFLFDRLSGLSNLNTFSNNVRVDNWSAAFHVISDQKVFYLWGLGLGTSLPGSLVKVENGFLTIFMELGFIGFVMWCGFNVYLIGLIFLKVADPLKRFNFLSFFVVFFLMNLGNDFVKVFPLSFLYWLYVYWVFAEVYRCRGATSFDVSERPR